LTKFQTVTGEWDKICRYDTAHGFAHLDILDEHRKVINKIPLSGTASFKEALTYAINDLKKATRNTGKTIAPGKRKTAIKAFRSIVTHLKNMDEPKEMDRLLKKMGARKLTRKEEREYRHLFEPLKNGR
jgi:rhamnogalacturonyl hydrolase YesR